MQLSDFIYQIILRSIYIFTIFLGRRIIMAVHPLVTYKLNQIKDLLTVNRISESGASKSYKKTP